MLSPDKQKHPRPSFIQIPNKLNIPTPKAFLSGTCPSHPSTPPFLEQSGMSTRCAQPAPQTHRANGTDVHGSYCTHYGTCRVHAMDMLSPYCGYAKLALLTCTTCTIDMQSPHHECTHTMVQMHQACTTDTHRPHHGCIQITLQTHQDGTMDVTQTCQTHTIDTHRLHHGHHGGGLPQGVGRNEATSLLPFSHSSNTGLRCPFTSSAVSLKNDLSNDL